jgi:hypothetical protein
MISKVQYLSVFGELGYQLQKFLVCKQPPYYITQKNIAGFKMIKNITDTHHHIYPSEQRTHVMDPQQQKATKNPSI